MKRVLVTGMSGTGKSALLDELTARGYECVDTDYGGYTVDTGDERLWDEQRVGTLLNREFADTAALFVQGTSGAPPTSSPRSSPTSRRWSR